MRVIRAQASPGGFLPEQVWDAPDVPDRELYEGRPSGSAMPLVWAHAEYVKLIRSLADGSVFDMPPQTVRRYRDGRAGSRLSIWRFDNKIRAIPAGRVLRIEVLASAVVHWSGDGWASVMDTPTVDTGVGAHCADLPTAQLAAGASIRFTFHWREADRWEGQDFTVVVRAG